MDRAGGNGSISGYGLGSVTISGAGLHDVSAGDSLAQLKHAKKQFRTIEEQSVLDIGCRALALSKFNVLYISPSERGVADDNVVCRAP